MTERLKAKHDKEIEELKVLCEEKRNFFKKKRSELDALDFKMRERHRNEMQNFFNQHFSVS